MDKNPLKTAPKMHIRPIEARDISKVIDIAMRAFVDDELFAWLAPKRYEYPTSWRIWHTSRVRGRFIEPGCWGYVCVPSMHAWDHDKIMGIAWWERGVGPESAPSVRAAGSGAMAEAAVAGMAAEEAARATREAVAADPWSANNRSWIDTVNRTLLRVESKFDMWMRPNRAGDYQALQIFRSSGEGDASVLGPLEFGVTHWHLGVLAVDPDFQRKGVGTELVKMGLEMARTESREKGFSVPVSLVASVMGNAMYKKLGFRVVDWATVPVDDIPFAGGAAMVWDESDTWIETAEEGTLLKGHKMDAVWSQRALDKVKNKRVSEV